MGRLINLAVIIMALLLLVGQAGAEVQTLMEGQTLEPSAGGGTILVVFGPEQSAGIIDACTLGYRAIGQDSVYRNDALFAIAGNISYGNYADRSSSYLAIKIGVFNTLDFSVKPEPPFFAYIQTAHETTAKSLKCFPG